MGARIEAQQSQEVGVLYLKIKKKSAKETKVLRNNLYQETKFLNFFL